LKGLLGWNAFKVVGCAGVGFGSGKEGVWWRCIAGHVDGCLSRLFRVVWSWDLRVMEFTLVMLWNFAFALEFGILQEFLYMELVVLWFGMMPIFSIWWWS
jgi:hypothetical protein